MHSRYRRRIADLPWQRRPVILCVHVRRLRCINRRCAQRIFAERAESFASGHARRTKRLRDIQRSVGLSAAKRALVSSSGSACRSAPTRCAGSSMPRVR
ncbi:hypothetical protein KRR38_32885 [Novosphingobium sp. G106]|nr:hypothetical protein [Novosphingobium sp. G106]